MENKGKTVGSRNDISSIAWGELLSVDIVCPACKNNKCAAHRVTVAVTDEQTGIKFEKPCVCKKHGGKRHEYK